MKQLNNKHAATEEHLTTNWVRRDSNVFKQPLQKYTKIWINQLPAEAQPTQCALKYPRILNKMAIIWRLPERCLEYLEELLADSRGGTRNGFDEAIINELQSLKKHVIFLQTNQ